MHQSINATSEDGRKVIISPPGGQPPEDAADAAAAADPAAADAADAAEAPPPVHALMDLNLDSSETSKDHLHKYKLVTCVHCQQSSCLLQVLLQTPFNAGCICANA